MKNSIFKGIYFQHEEASRACELANAKTEYPNDIWKSRQLAFLSEASAGRSPRPQILSGHLAKHHVRGVFDYGGGSGWTLTLMESLGYPLQERVIIETSQSISWFKELNPSLKWVNEGDTDSIKEIGSNTVFYSNSCIQYLRNYKDSLTNLLRHRWTHVIFEDLPNFSDRDIWTLQQYYGFWNPYHFFKIDDFTNFVESLGYELILQQNYIDSFPENWDYEIQDKSSSLEPNFPLSLIFKRK